MILIFFTSGLLWDIPYLCQNFTKKASEKTFLAFKNVVKTIHTAGYNGPHTVYSIDVTVSSACQIWLWAESYTMSHFQFFSLVEITEFRLERIFQPMRALEFITGYVHGL